VTISLTHQQGFVQVDILNASLHLLMALVMWWSAKMGCILNRAADVEVVLNMGEIWQFSIAISVEMGANISLLREKRIE
jgi:hypothetical protein